MKHPADYKGEPICPRCANGYPDCTDLDPNGVVYTHAESCGKYVWSDSLCDPCDVAFRAEILPKQHTPGDRVRVTAGDWCGETGTVVGSEAAGSVTLKLIDLDTGQRRLGITPDRLTPIGSDKAFAYAETMAALDRRKA